MRRLESRIRRRIREFESRRAAAWSWKTRLAPVLALPALCISVWILYNLGHLRVTTASQETYIQSISRRVPAILRVGLGGHVHCTVFRKFPKQPPTAAEMTSQLGPDYAGLLNVVKDRLPAEYQIVMAHRCSYHGRKFVRLAMKGDSALLSLVITDKRDGELLQSGNLAPVVSPSGVPIYQGTVQRFAIAGFEVGDHLAYLVSDLDPARNRSIVAAMVPGVRDFLSGIRPPHGVAPS